MALFDIGSTLVIEDKQQTQNIKTAITGKIFLIRILMRCSAILEKQATWGHSFYGSERPAWRTD